MFYVRLWWFSREKKEGNIANMDKERTKNAAELNRIFFVMQNFIFELLLSFTRYYNLY